jgi:hypothetical protein
VGEGADEGIVARVRSSSELRDLCREREGVQSFQASSDLYSQESNVMTMDRMIRRGITVLSTLLTLGRVCTTAFVVCGLLVIDFRVHAQSDLLDVTFDPGLGPNDGVRAMLVQPDGKIIVGGKFTIKE